MQVVGFLVRNREKRTSHCENRAEGCFLLFIFFLVLFFFFAQDLSNNIFCFNFFK